MTMWMLLTMLPTMIKSSSSSSSLRRFLPLHQQQHNNDEQQCLISYLECLNSASSCAQCFTALDQMDIQWTTNGITQDDEDRDKSCHSALQYLYQQQVCLDLNQHEHQHDDQYTMFCNVYQSCIVWKQTSSYYTDDINDNGSDDNGSDIICSELTECKWDGMSISMIGNGMCNREQCYNTELCNYDGGDCCEDTCQGNKFAECGVDGYACKNPGSTHCSPTLTEYCPITPSNDEKNSDNNNSTVPDKIICRSNEKYYKLLMYDSWGDGWDEKDLIIRNITNTNDDVDDVVYKVKLKDGFKNYEILCLQDGCFAASIGSSDWAEDISWELMASGTKIAFGGAPTDCHFSVGGNYCENTCNGQSNSNKNDDDDKMNQELEKCAKTKCPIQYGECQSDAMNCAPCIKDTTGLPFCLTNEKFLTLVQCVRCSCTHEKDEAACQSDKDNSDNIECDSAQSLHGTDALLKYTKCSNIDDELAMFKDWHEDQFGKLDDFEECAHEYSSNGVGKALDCMNILAGIVNDNEENEENPAILSIAKQLYSDPEGICDCSVEANKLCPNCDKFLRFKTLLHETLDACQSVDEVDCNAWEDFSVPCQSNVRAKFGSLDFSQYQQCFYVENGCGDAGYFPTFRRLDCDGEISKDAWNFFRYFEEGCKNGNDRLPVTAPVAVPHYLEPPTHQHPKPYVPSGPTPKQPTKPYVPPEDRGKKGEGSNSRNTNSNRGLLMWTLMLLVAGSGFYLFKQRQRLFNYPPNYQGYQKAQTRDINNSSSGNDLFAGLDVNNNSMSYEPVRIP